MLRFRLGLRTHNDPPPSSLIPHDVAVEINRLKHGSRKENFPEIIRNLLPIVMSAAPLFKLFPDIFDCSQVLNLFHWTVLVDMK